MKRELRDRWCAALRGGEYTQAHERLRRGGGFCCLGVLCNLLEPDGWRGNSFHLLGHGQRLSKETCAAVGLDTDLMTMLIGANDGEGGLLTPCEAEDAEDATYRSATFAEIADIIEANVTLDDETEEVA